MRELFVYYRVETAKAASAQAQVSALRAELALAAPELVVRLLKRVDCDPSEETWMETYAVDRAAGSSGGVDAAMQADIEARAARLMTAVQGSRQVEAFMVE